MEFIELISNANLKKLLKKKHLTEESVREIKTSFFIHPSTPEGEDTYSFNHANHDGFKVIELFTSLKEYNNEYEGNDEHVPLYWHFNQFENSLDDDTRGILINPSSDNFFIPSNLCFLIMDDMDDVERTIEFNDLEVDADDLKRLESKPNRLNDYLANKSKINYIRNLFDVLSASIVYVLYESQQSLDGHFENDMISIGDIELKYCKKDNHILVFSDKDCFKEVMDSKSYYCYGIADLIPVIRTVFELDYNGLILKTPDNEFELPRHRLLKYWDDIVENYDHLDIASKHAFKIGEDLL